MKTFVEIFRNVPTQWHNPKDAILWDKIGWSLSNERAIALTNGMEDFSVEKRINSLFNDYKDESFLCADRPENKICEAKWRDQYLPFLISKSPLEQPTINKEVTMNRNANFLLIIVFF